MQKRKKEREKKKTARRIRKRSKEWEIKILILAAYLEGLAVLSLVLQLEVVVQGHYGDTA